MGPFQAVVLKNNLMNNQNFPNKPKSAHHQRQEKIDSRNELITPQPCRIFLQRGLNHFTSFISIIPNDEELLESSSGKRSLGVTHDRWADLNTTKSWVQDILIQYYQQICEKSGLIVGTQQSILLVDCWWGWLDTGFRKWLKKEHPYVLLLFVPACCTPVGQPNDAGIKAILKGDNLKLKILSWNSK